MLRLILLSFAMTLVVSDVSGIKQPFHRNIDKTKNIDINPNVDDAYETVDKVQNLEKEILELKMMFQAKGQAMDNEMKKMQTKMKWMEKEIDNLRETVSSQSETIDDLKNSKTETEIELKTKIYQQEGELVLLKHKTELLMNSVKNMEMKINKMEEHSQAKSSSEMVNIVGDANETLVKNKT